MKKILSLSVVATLSIMSLEASDVTTMFKDAKVSGEVRTLYSYVDYKSQDDIYATAVGGYLKYELAKYKGLGAGVSFATSYDIDFLSGEDSKQNPNLSSQKTSYTQPIEAYVSYDYKNLGIKLGRQILDTPLADSDDIRMIFNTFEAYTLSYKLENLSFLAGHLRKWQGSDAGLDDGWSRVAKDGTNFIGISYESELFDSSLWYYNIDGTKDDGMANNSLYVDLVAHLNPTKDISLDIGIQYLNQNELYNSGVSSKIYGLSTEFGFKNLGVNIAYNRSSKESGKCSFSGFGGGTLFTNMDSMILDNITQDRDADAIVGGISYEIGNFNLFYSYGDFKGDLDSSFVKEHIVEQDAGIEYTPNDDIMLSVTYVKNDDKYGNGLNDGDWENIRVFASYSF